MQRRYEAGGAPGSSACSRTSPRWAMGFLRRRAPRARGSLRQIGEARRRSSVTRAGTAFAWPTVALPSFVVQSTRPSRTTTSYWHGGMTHRNSSRVRSAEAAASSIFEESPPHQERIRAKKDNRVTVRLRLRQRPKDGRAQVRAPQDGREQQDERRSGAGLTLGMVCLPEAAEVVRQSLGCGWRHCFAQGRRRGRPSSAW